MISVKKKIRSNWRKVHRTWSRRISSRRVADRPGAPQVCGTQQERQRKIADPAGLVEDTIPEDQSLVVTRRKD